jgi:ABC-type polysaccharide/polyol phosphate export permease
MSPVDVKDRFSSPTSFGNAVADLLTGLRLWRIWGMLALRDVRLRYRRSKLGQFWLTISMAITILALAFVYAAIFQIPLEIYLPMIAYSLIVWGLLAGICTEGSTTFIEAEGYIRSAPLAKSVYVYRVLLRNFIMFLHNLILAPIVMVIFGLVPNLYLLLIIPALVLTMVSGAWISLLLGTLSARFRDLPPIVASFTQIAFFLSPIMWTSNQLRGQFQLLTDWNPFAAFLNILRDPLLGLPPNPASWALALGVTIAGWIVTLLFYARFRSRISYYL